MYPDCVPNGPFLHTTTLVPLSSLLPRVLLESLLPISTSSPRNFSQPLPDLVYMVLLPTG